MRKISYIAVHCTATRPSMDIGVKEVTAWHKARGWKNCGYHWIIRRDGTLEKGRSEEQVGAHVAGHNKYSIGISLVGGVSEGSLTPEMNYTDEQMETLEIWLKVAHSRFPDAIIQGHRDFPGVAKACPCFDVKPWLEEIGL